MTEIEIMTQPTRPDVPPRLLMSDGGIWRDLGAPSTGNFLANKQAMTKAMHEAVANPHEFQNAVLSLRVPGTNLFKELVPPTLEEALRELLKNSDDGDPPLLRIHLDAGHEWIPWEVLHTGKDFLGLRFRIARLPIVQSPPAVPADCEHPVTRVRSLLGREIAEPTDPDFDKWLQMFTGLVPPGAANFVPPDAAGDTWPETLALLEEADILHVTCHGMRDDAGPYWNFNPSKKKALSANTLSSGQVSMLSDIFDETHPLVFGNACAPQEADPPAESEAPALGTAFFQTGALNFVGTVAPIRRPVALRFARYFFEELLGKQDPVSDAVLQAKRKCHELDEEPRDPTYLFYCLYGPPETRYLTDNGGEA